MNKIILVFMMTLVVLVLSACGSSTGAQTISTVASETTATSLSTEMTFLLGTFKLEGTDQAVTAEQAAKLLPLWQVYGELLSSDTTAQAEINALAVQIEDTMTADQVKAIQAMNLTQQDLFTLMQEEGMNLSASSATSSESASDAGGMVPPDGGMEMGNPPDGGMPMGDGGAPSMPNSANTNSTSESPTSFLVDALIELLQSRMVS